jgi:hypothetical protein
VWSSGLIALLGALTVVATPPPADGTTLSPTSVTLPGGQKLPEGATVTTVLRFHGRWIAAGGDFPAGARPALSSCPADTGCNPIVWTSTDRTHWTAVWGAAASGSITGEQLVAGEHDVLLFNADEGTALWTSHNGDTWTSVRLPDDMKALVARNVVFGHGRYVVMLNNKFAEGSDTAYGESDTVWTSTNGTTWTQDVVPGPASAFDSLTVAANGFRLFGVTRPGGDAEAWRSTNGVTWKIS